MSQEDELYFFSGGGSGGHVTPLVAVAEELKKRCPQARVHAVVHRGDSGGVNRVVKDSGAIDEVHEIFAGKLRRYHGEGLKQLLDIKEMLKNLRDVFYVIVGFIQSLYLVLRYKPKALFMRGGYVGVPLGFAARLLHRPYLTHDSDAVASLANRLIARGASAHAVGLPKENYRYNQSRTHHVGIPVNKAYTVINSDLRETARQELKLPHDAEVVLVTGGGLGARSLNRTAAAVLLRLLKSRPRLFIIHIAGKKLQEEVEHLYRNTSRSLVYGFTNELRLLSEASDVVITRAGATALTEFSIQKQAMIIVPNNQLTGGHQLQNARVYQENSAAVLVDEDENTQEVLYKTVNELLDNPAERGRLGESAEQLVKKDAAENVVDILIKLHRKK